MAPTTEIAVYAALELQNAGRQQISLNGGTGGTAGPSSGWNILTNNLLGHVTLSPLTFHANKGPFSSFYRTYIRNRQLRRLCLFSSRSNTW